VQKPVEHSDGALQDFPKSPAGSHAPALQKYPAAQSARTVHEVLHAVAPHAYAPHGTAVSPHAPAPVQVFACVSMPPLHELLLHAVPLAGYVHAVRTAPSQWGPHSLPTPVPVQAARVPRGAPVTATHLPGEAPSAHASHCPSQAAVQHRPSAQNPLLHIPALEQAVPMTSFGLQVPASQ
jgi:hypothetical protein